MNNTKEVHFWFWCPTCKHYAKDQSDTPCDECLAVPMNIDSTKPVRYEEEKE